MKTNKGFIGIGLLLAILAVLAVGGGAVFYAKKTPATAPAPKNIPVKIPDDVSKKVSQDISGYQKAKVVNLTGLDGCDYLIELENGQRLEPTNLTNEFKKDQLPVLIKYKEVSINSVCMAGKGVELTDIISNTLPTSTSYTLIINQGGKGQGNVTSTPSRINCGYLNNSGPDCSQSFLSGSTVTLNAVASSGSYFAGWGQDCSGTKASFTLIMNGYKQCAPTFNLNTQ